MGKLTTATASVYRVHITVERVDSFVTTDDYGDRPSSASENIVQVTDLHSRSATLPALIERATAHLALVVDDTSS